MTQILKSLEGELKIAMINMLGAVMEKVDNMQEQIGNVNREMETIINNQKKPYKSKAQ